MLFSDRELGNGSISEVRTMLVSNGLYLLDDTRGIDVTTLRWIIRSLMFLLEHIEIRSR